jgi:hypothetical protein
VLKRFETFAPMQHDADSAPRSDTSTRSPAPRIAQQFINTAPSPREKVFSRKADHPKTLCVFT